MVAPRIAVLVDGDNIGALHADRIMSEAGRLGRIDIARVYAAADRRADWRATPGFRLIHAGEGKNAADLLLSIDAMEFALDRGVETFAIATSDGDFSHLAHRLRERGLHVLGLGETKAPEGFRTACSAFIGLPQSQPRCHKPRCSVSKLDRHIRAMIAKHSQEGSGMRLVNLGCAMNVEHGTQIKSYPDRSWRAYLAARPALYDLDPTGPDAYVRFRPEGFASA